MRRSCGQQLRAHYRQHWQDARQLSTSTSWPSQKLMSYESLPASQEAHTPGSGDSRDARGGGGPNSNGQQELIAYYKERTVPDRPSDRRCAVRRKAHLLTHCAFYHYILMLCVLFGLQEVTPSEAKTQSEKAPEKAQPEKDMVQELYQSR